MDLLMMIHGLVDLREGATLIIYRGIISGLRRKVEGRTGKDLRDLLTIRLSHLNHLYMVVVGTLLGKVSAQVKLRFKKVV